MSPAVSDLKMCLVADGTADLFVKDVVVRDWDVAPALAVLRSVGALLTQANGSPFLLAGAYDKPGGLLVARDRALWERAAMPSPARRAGGFRDERPPRSRDRRPCRR